MFGKSDSHLHAGATTLIAKNTEITGDIRFSGHLEIEGVFRGNILAAEGSPAALRIHHEGVVTGKIQAPTVIINGHVEGDIHCSKHLELAAKATVKGNLYYHYLEVVKGARVNGKMVHVAEPDATNNS